MPAVNKAAPMDTEADRPLAGQTILLVDDTPANLKVLAHALEDAGLQVLVALDGEEAVRCALAVVPDLILLDILMPGIDGLETCRRLKAESTLHDIPVVFMSALSEHSDKLRGFRAGGVDYITKPFDIQEALARIRTHLNLRDARRHLAEQNAALQTEIALRRQAEIRLQHAYCELDSRVAQRTAELGRAHARLRRLVESNIIGIYFWTVDGTITEANDAFLHLLGYTQQDLQDGKIGLANIAPPGYRAIARKALDTLRARGRIDPVEREYLHRDGTRIPILIGAAFINGEQREGVSFVLDLSERKKAEERIRYMADHDALTGLPNRTLLRDRLQQAIAHAHRTGTRVAVLFIDLDYFKHINDSLGHQIGDTLLKMVAARLTACVREGDSVARLGGDEFVLTLPLAEDGSTAAIVARKTLAALDKPFQCCDHELHVGSSIGISLYPDDGKDVDTLMRTADTAMYHAKEKGRGNYQFFTPSLNRAAQRRHAMTNALRHALIHEEFTLFYQPQVELDSGRIFSAEALLRWNRNGQVSGTCHEFITIAEETGLILPIGEWVLRQACLQLRRWHELGFADLDIAVNLSPRQFFQPDFRGMVGDILRDAGVPPSRLDLEITESTLMQRTEDNMATLKQLAGMGIKLSVDDFGTGYSSLAYLQRFPVDALKIDRAFVSGIGQNANDTALVEAIISMAHSLRLRVLAEGVETPEQKTFLQALGCPAAQGFYYGAAVPAEEFTELLRRQRISA
ncbi:EAL domain-containing protein [Noviherbaspirillum denitrificans]|uniref:EAL domain-containing response regulator n=1 Tax=Noviherbaspirillum denitrificans TaxID=1968433 RepID=UPI000B5333E3|nr:EAL domain-containing protein [Noviherbaspirillum denitrificans]